MKTLTPERLRELLDYDPESGKFRWTTAATRNRGLPAGTIDCDGYVIVRIDEKSYKAHRLAWLYVHGRWPTAQIDHRNRTRSDNRIANLREAPGPVNQQNAALRSHFPGAYRRKRPGAKPWTSRIFVNGKRRQLGCFATAAEASAAYLTAKAALHPHWSREC